MVFKAIKSFFNNRFDKWLKRRVPSKSYHQLSRHNIFIMPTRFGFAFMFFVFILFLLATNYQNNIIMLMSYLLASFFITVMLHSFYNFSGLAFKSSAEVSGFAKQSLNLPISIITKKEHFDLTLNFAKLSKPMNSKSVHLKHCQAGTTEVAMPLMVEQRGKYNLGRIKVSSEYSFGLFVSWAVLDFSHQVTVYPQAKKISAHQLTLTGDNNHDQQGQINANHNAELEEFYELKDYIQGESKTRIAWKQLARGQGRYSKHYQSPQKNLQWLKLAAMPGNDLESQLSFLCYLVLEYNSSEQRFGLDLTSQYSPSIHQDYKISPDKGIEHQKSCLTALATFNQRANTND